MGPTNYAAGPGHKSWDFIKLVKDWALQAWRWGRGRAKREQTAFTHKQLHSNGKQAKGLKRSAFESCRISFMLQLGALCCLLGSGEGGTFKETHPDYGFIQQPTPLPTSGPKTHLGPCVNSFVRQGFDTRHLSRGASQVVLVVKNPPASDGDVRDAGSISGLGRSPRGGHGNPPQYSCLENPMHRGAWRAIFHGVTRVGHD